jgi:hypothetical protein
MPSVDQEVKKTQLTQSQESVIMVNGFMTERAKDNVQRYFNSVNPDTSSVMQAFNSSKKKSSAGWFGRLFSCCRQPSDAQADESSKLIQKS